MLDISFCRYFQLKADDICLSNGTIDSILEPAKCLEDIGIAPGTGEERHIDIIEVFNHLAKQIQNLSDFPLFINDVRMMDSVFRAASVNIYFQKFQFNCIIWYCIVLVSKNIFVVNLAQ